MGIDKAEVERIREVMRTGPATVGPDLIPDEHIDRIAVVGSPEECREGFAALGDAGADIFGLRPSLELLERFDYEAMVHRLWTVSQARQ